MTDIRDVEVIAPNLKRRLSGVTATVHTLVPLQVKDIVIAATGPALPNDIPQIPLSSLLALPRNRARVWHARRNVEMIAGLALRTFLGKRLKLLFTSASQREHTLLSRWLINRMDEVVAVSDRSAAYLTVPNKVIRHGIDTARFQPSSDKRALRRQLGLPTDPRLVGCFGRIRAQKGTGDYVDAMLELLPKHPGVTAIAMGGTVGHESYAEELTSKVTEAGMTDRLLLLPEVPVDAMPDWYAALDLYVAPQRWEGFGLTVLEAMAAGVPVVATKVGAFEELVAHGETGLLIDPENIPQMSEAIGQLLDKPEQLAKLASAARPHVTRNHPIDGEARALVALYREMLGTS